jgi:hypothetical protein
MSILKRFTQYVSEFVEEINLQMDERERYRAALELIASTDAPLSQDDMGIAREALTDSEEKTG